MERAILVALQRQRQQDWEVEENLWELEELAIDAGIDVLDTVVQRKEKPEAATFIGTGKAKEIAAMLEPGVIVIFDDELTPAQQGNLSELMDAPVVDRTQLILDIFAKRARSNEGKIQVELAQLNYLLPRLVGQGKALSRLGAGIGTRGPGETKLETDRRRIRTRISDLQKELEQVKKVRDTQRQSRLRLDVPVVSLVGYTNAGKSTLLSALTEEDTYIADQLFATLDPTIRRWQLGENRWVFLSDTVGFIRKLPHTVVAAFRATLEEVTRADLLLHVIDSSHPQMEEQIEAVEQVLEEIGAHQEMLYVYNKKDLVEHPLAVQPPNQAISALTRENLDQLVNTVDEYFRRKNSVCTYFFSFEQLKESQQLRDQALLLNEEFSPTGVKLVAEVTPTVAQKMKKWEIEGTQKKQESTSQ